MVIRLDNSKHIYPLSCLDRPVESHRDQPKEKGLENAYFIEL